MKKRISLLMASALLATASASASPAKSEKQAMASVEFRQAVLKLVRSNVGPLSGMAKGRIAYDADASVKHAERIAQLSMMMGDYFVTDTRGFDVPTEALDAIWEDKADFDAKLEDFKTAAAALVVAAKTGDENTFKQGFGKVGRTCKNCHDSYKKD